MAVYSQLQRVLFKTGLGEIETRLYIELLKKPVAKKYDLVLRTGFSKSSVYRAIEKMRSLNMIQGQKGIIKARSLSVFVSNLSSQERKLRKLVLDLKRIAPFLHSAHEPMEVFETLYTKEQIQDAYIFMSETDYSVNLDFGDFEHFIPLIGGIDFGNIFRKNRLQHADHHAICTTFGPYSSYYCTREAEKKYKNKVDLLKVKHTGQFTIFSDTSDYVLFNHFDDPENMYSVLVKSKGIADAQRTQFDLFSQLVGKI